MMDSYHNNLKLFGWNIEKHREAYREEIHERRISYNRIYSSKYYKLHKEKQRERDARFKKLHPNYMKKYLLSKRGRSSHKKAQAKRRHNLGWIVMFSNPFDESEVIEWHHVDDSHVVALPKDLHRQYLGKSHRDNLINIIKQIY